MRTRPASLPASSGDRTTPALTSIELLARETRVTPGVVPDSIDGCPVAMGMNLLRGDTYVLHSKLGFAFHYRRGHGIVVERQPWARPGNETLLLNGSVYAAVACINGFRPIHASAVAHKGRVYAFTGPAGAGKSTLSAALGPRGLPLFCDDTLVLDLSDPERIMCLPGHKRLKLLPDAFELTGARIEEEVGAGTGKFYAKPAAGAVREPLPLAELTFIEEGPGPDLLPVAGAERFVRLADDHYTTEFFEMARAFERGEAFAMRARLARQIPMSRLVRPRDASRFAASVDLVERHIRRQDQIRKQETPEP